MVDRREQDTTLYLTQMLSSKRKPIEQSLFDKDPTLQERINQYQGGLLEFLRQPDTLSLGDTLCQLDIRTDLLLQSHNQRASDLDQMMASSRQQREEVSQKLQQMEGRIKGIGRGRILQGDLPLLIGEIQVHLGQLQNKGRLNFIDKALIKLFTTRKTHPQLEFYQEQLSQLGPELDQLEIERKQSSDGFVTERVNLGRQTHTQQKQLFHQLDQWAIETQDRFLVHYLYHSRPHIIRFLRKKGLGIEEKAEFLAILGIYGLDSRAERLPDSLRSTAQPPASKDTELLSETFHTLLFHKGGRQMPVSAKEKLDQVLREVLSQKIIRDSNRFARLTADLLQLARSENPLLVPGVKKIVGGEDLKQGVGGEFRFANKDRRVIFSLVKKEGQMALDIGYAGYRDESTYGRWD